MDQRVKRAWDIFAVGEHNDLGALDRRMERARILDGV
jgi:hypothetical protein